LGHEKDSGLVPSVDFYLSQAPPRPVDGISSIPLGRNIERRSRVDFVSFAAWCFRELNPAHRFAASWHVELMAGDPRKGRPSGEAAVREGRIRRLIISVPPRHLKSHLASVAFPAWCLGYDPNAQIVCVTPGVSGDGPSRA
jgi:hypothetical protein